ncbi:MAG: hypothetical protein EAZ36_01860, partial [Verrucomicrobia bacterium]
MLAPQTGGIIYSRMKRFLFISGLLSACLTVLPAQAVKVVGSDLLADAVGPELSRFAAASDVTLTHKFTGSRLGIKALTEGTADFGLLLFAPGEAQPGENLAKWVIGYMPALVVIPESAPLTQLHYAQLAGVFGANETNNFRRWSEPGVGGNWGVRSITVAAGSRRAGLAIDLFRFEVLRTPEFKSTMTLFDDAASVLERISGEEGGIALVSSPPAPGSELKVLLVAKGPNDVAYGPTSENLHTGDYPLRIPVYLVARKT